LRRSFAALVVSLTLAASAVFAQNQSGAIDASAVKDKPVKSLHVTPRGHLNGQGHARFGAPFIDSLPNFNGQFFAAGVNSNGDPENHWYYNTVGNPPQLGGTTNVNVPIIPVRVQLLNADGSVRFVHEPGPIVQPAVASPMFQNFNYSSSIAPTQFGDAIQRAEYFAKAKDDWHTMLTPSVKTTRTVSIPAGKYSWLPNADGSCCRLILIDVNTWFDVMFPTTSTDTTTVIGAAENAGEMTTKDMSVLLVPDTVLYVGTPNVCCIGGFHTYDFEPGDASNGNVEKRYVSIFAGWQQAGIFRAGTADITALSHEILEALNDPFVTSDGIHNITPWWLSANGQCQNDLETGDVIEGFPNQIFPITMNGMTYHPQNEALLQWFEFKSPSDALHGAYSYPDETVLTNLSAPQKAGCQ